MLRLRMLLYGLRATGHSYGMCKACIPCTWSSGLDIHDGICKVNGLVSRQKVVSGELKGVDFFAEGGDPVLIQDLNRLIGLVDTYNNDRLAALSPP